MITSTTTSTKSSIHLIIAIIAATLLVSLLYIINSDTSAGAEALNKSQALVSVEAHTTCVGEEVMVIATISNDYSQTVNASIKLDGNGPYSEPIPVLAGEAVSPELPIGVSSDGGTVQVRVDIYDGGPGTFELEDSYEPNNDCPENFRNISVVDDTTTTTVPAQVTPDGESDQVQTTILAPEERQHDPSIEEDPYIRQEPIRPTEGAIMRFTG